MTEKNKIPPLLNFSSHINFRHQNDHLFIHQMLLPCFYFRIQQGLHYPIQTFEPQQFYNGECISSNEN